MWGVGCSWGQGRLPWAEQAASCRVKPGSGRVRPASVRPACTRPAPPPGHNHRQPPLQRRRLCAQTAGLHARHKPLQVRRGRAGPCGEGRTAALPAADPRNPLPPRLPALASRTPATPTPPPPPRRQFLISWVAVLESVPDLDLLAYLPELLDGLLNTLSDPNRRAAPLAAPAPPWTGCRSPGTLDAAPRAACAPPAWPGPSPSPAPPLHPAARPRAGRSASPPTRC
jgi:hypothetical protein